MFLTFQSFYSIFFEELANHDLLYTVVRNYEDLPGSKPGGDVDILIEKEKIDNVLSVVNKIIEEVNGKIEITSTRYYVTKLKLHGVLDNQTNKPVTELDLITKLSWKGLSWLSESEVLKKSVVNEQSICIPMPHHELQMSLFHSLLYGGFVKERYQKQMDSLFVLGSQDLVKNDLVKNFGSNTGEFIFANIRQSHWSILEKNVLNIRKAVLETNLRSRGLLAFFSVSSHFYFEIIIRMRKFLKK